MPETLTAYLRAFDSGSTSPGGTDFLRVAGATRTTGRPTIAFPTTRRGDIMASNDRREFLGAALFGAAGGSVAGLPRGRPRRPTGGPVPGHRPYPPGAPGGRPRIFSGHRRRGAAGVFVSGQGPKDLKADMETQVRQTFDRIGLVLKAAGRVVRGMS